jgi:hypothetical protein
VRPGEGQDGADRVTLIWEDGVIRNCCLQVTVMATDATGLTENEVFYVGNAVAESGNSTTDALVNATDEIGTRHNPHSPFHPAAKDDHFDYNRDELVNATDQIIEDEHKDDGLCAQSCARGPMTDGRVRLLVELNESIPQTSDKCTMASPVSPVTIRYQWPFFFE